MTTQFNYQHVSGSERLENFTKEKLEVLFTRYNWITSAAVFFTAEKTSNDETGMKTGIRLSAPGPRLFAEESTETFEDGILQVINQLKQQCEKRKSELIKHA